MARRVSGGIVAALVFATAAATFAADENAVIVPGATRTAAPAASAAGSVTSGSLWLGLALAAAGGWMVWRNRRGTPVGRNRQALAVDETRSLGNRQFLVVASYEGKKFLLGVCPGRIEMLAPLDGSAPEQTRE